MIFSFYFLLLFQTLVSSLIIFVFHFSFENVPTQTRKSSDYVRKWRVSSWSQLLCVANAVKVYRHWRRTGNPWNKIIADTPFAPPLSLDALDSLAAHSHNDYFARIKGSIQHSLVERSHTIYTVHTIHTVLLYQQQPWLSPLKYARNWRKKNRWYH